MAEMTMLIRALQSPQRLATHRDVTVKELHELMERRESKQTIHRTIRQMKASGIPIVEEAGPHNEKFYSIYLALSRFRGAELTDDGFDRDPAYSLVAVLRDSFGIWYEEPVQVVIRFDATVRESIESRH
ncbi:MAG: HTH domain-containing protein [Bacteroidetes bacterium]|nr:HTH domain-containing protein [Bacteroidota bacterium]